MKHTFESGVLTVCLEGHIDTSNAPVFEMQVFALISDNSPTSVILDADKLEYISSSGLRVILKLRKKFPTLKMINTSSEVYEILDMTGFTELMTVEKAYRRFDVTGCQVIGKGANGTVYRIDRDTIVKVYKEYADLDDIKRERELSRTAFVRGIPTAIPYDVVRVGNCYGSVFELLNAKSFDELMIEDPANLDFVVKKSVEIAKLLHSTEAPENLPSQRQIAMEWLNEADGYMDKADHQKLKELITALPESPTMLHGDYHIKNIMQQDEETLLIDLDTICYGHPIFEFAFMFNAYIGFGLADPTRVEEFLGISSDLAYQIWRGSLEEYFGTKDDAVLNPIEEKAMIIGCLRLFRLVIRKGRLDTPAGKALNEASAEKLHQLLPKYDSLEF